MDVKVKIGEIIFNELKDIIDIPFEKQVWNFKEDLLKIKHKDYILDLGWYPSFELSGKFVLYVTDLNWEDTYLRKEFKFKDIEAVQMEIDKGLGFLIKHSEMFN